MVQPPGDEEAPDMMRRQIELVSGGNQRINRAKVVRWKGEQEPLFARGVLRRRGTHL